MVNAAPSTASPRIRCRQIEDADLASVVDLLKKGFGARRSRRFWRKVIDRLISRVPPDGLPKYGYLLQSDGRAVGVILQIFATIRTGPVPTVRCSVSSWYVDPKFRSYAGLLSAQALKHKGVTYLNVSPAPNTWPLLEAQGYQRLNRGAFLAIPVLSSRSEPARIMQAGDPEIAAGAVERELLLQHADYGCHAFWCVNGGQAFPFVFRTRVVKRVIPCLQLVYCRDVADVARFAAPIGRYLALRGFPLVVIDADGPIAGLPGKYFDGVMTKFVRGPDRPRLGDLAYSELAVLGI